MTELSENGKLTTDQRLFFGAGPALELGLTATSFGEGWEDFDSEDGGRRIDLRCSAGLSAQVVVEPLVQGGRTTDVDCA